MLLVVVSCFYFLGLLYVVPYEVKSSATLQLYDKSKSKVEVYLTVLYVVCYASFLCVSGEACKIHPSMIVVASSAVWWQLPHLLTSWHTLLTLVFLLSLYRYVSRRIAEPPPLIVEVCARRALPDEYYTVGCADNNTRQLCS